MASLFFLSHVHTHTHTQHKCNFSMIIIITRVMQTSRGRAFVSLLSTEYVTVKPDSKLMIGYRVVKNYQSMKGMKREAA